MLFSPSDLICGEQCSIFHSAVPPKLIFLQQILPPCTTAQLRLEKQCLILQVPVALATTFIIYLPQLAKSCFKALYFQRERGKFNQTRRKKSLRGDWKGAQSLQRQTVAVRGEKKTSLTPASMVELHLR